jgi:hypothetical protein
MSYQNLKIEQVECLILWPEGTKGYEWEKNALKTLIDLCSDHGYGRVPQLAKSIKEIWSDNSKIEDFEVLRKEHLDLIEGARKEYEKSLLDNE